MVRLLTALALAGCAGPPLVDMTDVDPVVYQRDFDHCEMVAQGSVPAGPVVIGALMGATIGVGAAGFITAVPAATAASGIGAASGAAAGAGVSAASGQPLAVPPQPTRQSLADCLASHGYKVIAR